MRLPPKLYSIYQAFWRPVFAPFTSGTNIFTCEWDLLIILDGCRVDTFRHVCDNYSFVDDVKSVRSVGSQSKEWLAKTFVPEWSEEIKNTTYITANVFTEEVFGESQNNRRTNPANWTTIEREAFGDLIELWRTEWDNELDTVPPRPVTDAAIATARESEPERMIVHYMQPHEPFIAGNDPIHDVWQKLRSNELSKKIAQEYYRENLRLVLNDVELLLENINASKTVITSDHGNAFGEWGIFGHPIGFQHPVVKNVPWTETEATDHGTYISNWSEQIHEEHIDIEERLKALGYR